MKSIPTQSNQDENAAPSASDLIKSTSTAYPPANQRSVQGKLNRIYPLLLLASTAVAVFFAFMYINKPVFVAVNDFSNTENEQSAQSAVTRGKNPGLLPPADNLPGEGLPTDSTENPLNLTTAPLHSHYEETNMRVQHILSAKSENGHVSRIDLEVPVLYESRKMRWTPAEVDEANRLMMRLMDYQEKSHKLRAQGEQLLIDWNALIGKSIPASKLRADSPSIPENQQAVAILKGAPAESSAGVVEIDTEEDKP